MKNIKYMAMRVIKQDMLLSIMDREHDTISAFVDRGMYNSLLTICELEELKKFLSNYNYNEELLVSAASKLIEKSAYFSALFLYLSEEE